MRLLERRYIALPTAVACIWRFRRREENTGGSMMSLWADYLDCLKIGAQIIPINGISAR
jgi:hypothetical protein